MATDIGSIYIGVRPDMRTFNTQVAADATSTGTTSGKSFSDKFAKAASIGLAAFGAAKLFGGLIQDASDLSETASKIGVVFGDAAGGIQAFAASGAQSLGQSKQSVLDAAATFGVYGKAAGLAGQANADFSTELVSVSADLASFYNTSPEDAINAIGSALRGEAEPLRAYGVLLDDASLRQEAMKQGLIATTTQALTPQQKVLAAHALILQQTGIAQGDFARTSDGLANQQRILAATFTNVKTQIGTALLPAALAGTAGLSGMLTALTTGEQSGDGFAGAMSRVGQAVRGVWDLVVGGDFTAAFSEAFGVEENSPVVGFLLDIRNNISGLFDNFDGKAFSDVMADIWGNLQKLWPFFKALLDELPGFNTLFNAGAAVLRFFADHVDILYKLLPLIVTAFIAWKLAMLAGFPIALATLGVQVSLAASNRALAAALNALTGAQNTSILAMLRAKVAAAALWVWQNTITVATKAWAAAQWLLNAAMQNNPIGWLVRILILLGAGLVVAYQRSEEFRAAVDAAWEAIQDAVDYAWNQIIKPAFSAMVYFFTDQLGPALLWFWHEVVEPAFAVIGDIIETAWTYVIYPALQALWWYISEILAPVLMWLRNEIVWPVMQGIGDIISAAWNDVIQPVFGFLKDGVGAVGGAFGATKDFIADVWDQIQDKALSAWNWINNNVFNPFKAGIVQIGDAFTAVKDFIADVWDDITGVIADAINGVIGFINPFLDGINTIADAVGFDLNLHIDLIGGGGGGGGGGPARAYADGGIYPGYTPGRDVGYIEVSGGEAIMRPEWTRAVETYNPGYVDAANRAAKAGGVGGAARFLGYFEGGGTVDLMTDLIRGAFPGARMTSGYRPGDPGYHGSYQAADFAGPTPGDGPYMLDINKWIAANFPGAIELIHTPGINLLNGNPHTYNSATQADHYDHVHWAETDPSYLAAGGFIPAGRGSTSTEAKLGALASGIVNPIMAAITALTDGSDILSTFGHAANYVIQKAVDAITAADDAGSYDNAAVSGAFADNVAIVQADAAKYGWSTGQQWADLQQLVQHESGFNNTAQNPTSTAYGMYQFLDSTWAPYGPKTSDPALQALYGNQYIGDRYGSASDAWGFWQRNNYYDDGGLIYPGTVGVNVDGGVERVLNEQQTVAFEHWMNAGAGDRVLNVRVVGGEVGARVTNGGALLQVIERGAQTVVRRDHHFADLDASSLRRRGN